MDWVRWLLQKAGTVETPSVPTTRIKEFFEQAAADEEHFPSTIDPRIYHVQLILDQFGDLAGKRVADIGCGKGRFARILKDKHPAATIAAVDLAESMLRVVPEGLLRCAASMTALPLQTEAFDCVYATESLEHAVDTAAAVTELCRVLKPGGRLVIIDKNIEHWGRLQTPEWERWFGRRELEKLLKRHCRNVSSKPISYWEDVAPDGLFFAWLAEK